MERKRFWPAGAAVCTNDEQSFPGDFEGDTCARESVGSSQGVHGLKSNVQRVEGESELGFTGHSFDPDGDDGELAHTLTVSQFAALFVAIVFEARATPSDLVLSLNRPDFFHSVDVHVWAVRNLSEVHLLFAKVLVHVPMRDLRFFLRPPRGERADREHSTWTTPSLSSSCNPLLCPSQWEMLLQTATLNSLRPNTPHRSSSSSLLDSLCFARGSNLYRRP